MINAAPFMSTELCCCFFLAMQIHRPFWRPAGNAGILCRLVKLRYWVSNAHLVWCLQIAVDLFVQQRRLFPVASAYTTADICALQPLLCHVQFNQWYTALTQFFPIKIDDFRFFLLVVVSICSMLCGQKILSLIRYLMSFFSQGICWRRLETWLKNCLI